MQCQLLLSFHVFGISIDSVSLSLSPPPSLSLTHTVAQPESKFFFFLFFGGGGVTFVQQTFSFAINNCTQATGKQQKCLSIALKHKKFCDNNNDETSIRQRFYVQQKIIVLKPGTKERFYALFFLKYQTFKILFFVFNQHLAIILNMPSIFKYVMIVSFKNLGGNFKEKRKFWKLC